MRIRAFITHIANIRQILEHVEEQSEPPNIAQARGPPMSADFDAPLDELPKPMQAEIWWRNRHRTTSLASASIEE